MTLAFPLAMSLGVFFMLARLKGRLSGLKTRLDMFPGEGRWSEEEDDEWMVDPDPDDLGLAAEEGRGESAKLTRVLVDETFEPGLVWTVSYPGQTYNRIIQDLCK